MTKIYWIAVETVHKSEHGDMFVHCERSAHNENVHNNGARLTLPSGWILLTSTWLWFAHCQGSTMGTIDIFAFSEWARAATITEPKCIYNTFLQQDQGLDYYYLKIWQEHRTLKKEKFTIISKASIRNSAMEGKLSVDRSEVCNRP